MEILEFCNDNLNLPKKDNKLGQPDEFKTMFTSEGKHLKTITDIQEFLISRIDQSAGGSNSKLS